MTSTPPSQPPSDNGLEDRGPESDEREDASAPSLEDTQASAAWNPHEEPAAAENPAEEEQPAEPSQPDPPADAVEGAQGEEAGTVDASEGTTEGEDAADASDDTDEDEAGADGSDDTDEEGEDDPSEMSPASKPSQIDLAALVADDPEEEPAPAEPGPESGPEPLSMRDIEQVVVPQSYYKSDDEEAGEQGEDRSAALRPVDLGSLAPPPVEPKEQTDLDELAASLDVSSASDPEPMPLSVRDFEEDLTGRPSAPPDSDSEQLSLRDVEEELSPRSYERETAKEESSDNRSVPPPLPPKSERSGPAGPPMAHGIAPSVDPSRAPSLVRAMLERLADSDYEAALLASDALLRIDPKSSDALQAAQISKAALYRLYDKRLGSRQRVPILVVPIRELRFQPLDARSVLVLSRVDGDRSVDDVINSGVLPKLDALRILSELYLGAIIGFADED